MLRDSQVNIRIDREQLSWLRTQKMAFQAVIIREGIDLWRQHHDPAFKDQRIKKIEKEINMKSEELKQLKEENEAEVDGTVYDAILQEAKAWFYDDTQLQPPYTRLDDHFLWKEIKTRFYPKLKHLPQGKGETKPVIDKFMELLRKSR